MKRFLCALLLVVVGFGAAALAAPQVAGSDDPSEVSGVFGGALRVIGGANRRARRGEGRAVRPMARLLRGNAC